MGVLYKSGAADSIVIPGLVSQADTKLLITNPTIAAGDVKIWNPNTSAWDNLATTPTALSATGTAVLVSWSAAEAAYSPFVIVWQDAAGAQWCSGGLSIRMGARDIADLAFPTTTGRSIDVTATGEVGIDWANVGAPTTALNLSGTTIKAVTDAVTAPAGMATSANQTTIMNRLGAFTGTGVNTVLGVFKALFSKAAALPSDITGTNDPATDSTEALREAIDAAALSWAGGDVAASVSTGVITVIEGDAWIIPLTNLASSTGYTHIDVTVKNGDSDDDDAAVVHWRVSATPEATDGLVRLNGAGSASLLTAGHITVVSATAITLYLDGDKAAQVAPVAGRVYDVQYFFTGVTDSPRTVRKSTFNVTAGVTKRID